MDIKVDNIDSCCRTCMESSSSEMFDMFIPHNDISIVEMLTWCTSIKVDIGDTLPQKMCCMCYKQLTAFTAYRKQAELVDSKLREILLSNNKKVDIRVKEEIIPFNDDQYDDDYPSDYDHNDDATIKEENIEVSEKKEKKFTCNICLETYNKLLKLRDHIQQQHPEAKVKSGFKCKDCGKTFKHHNKLLRHKKVHSLHNHPYPCMLCQKGFKRQCLLRNHLIIEHNQIGNIEREVMCENDIDSSNVNPIKMETNEAYICDMCPSTFDSNHSLAAHKKKHTKLNRILSCTICGKVFKKLSHLKRHELIHDINRPFKCCLCTKSFISNLDLVAHMNKHKGITSGPYKCAICSKEFTHKSTLTMHVRLHSGEKPYLCTTCGKRFNSSNNLKQHMRRHTGEKPFECRMCPKKFVSQGELKSHIVTHTGHRAWTCDLCGSSFTKSTSLSKHKIQHLGIKPHQCDACPMKFAVKDHLKRHYRIHTGEKPYKCDLCERAFSQSNDLVKHKRSHLGEKLYRCNQCSEGFRLKQELNRHISEHFLASKLGTESIDTNIDINKKDIEENSRSQSIGNGVKDE